MIDSLIINEPIQKKECRIEFNSKIQNPKLMRLVLKIAEWANNQGMQGNYIQDCKFLHVSGKTYFTCKI